jgi:hypothetical protein
MQKANVGMRPRCDCRRVFTSEQEREQVMYQFAQKYIMASHSKAANIWPMKWLQSIKFHALKPRKKIK